MDITLDSSTQGFLIVSGSALAFLILYLAVCYLLDRLAEHDSYPADNDRRHRHRKEKA